jgi:hypothetical protein
MMPAAAHEGVERGPGFVHRVVHGLVIGGSVVHRRFSLPHRHVGVLEQGAAEEGEEGSGSSDADNAPHRYSWDVLPLGLQEVVAAIQYMPAPARKALIHEMNLWRQDAIAAK